MLDLAGIEYGFKAGGILSVIAVFLSRAQATSIAEVRWVLLGAERAHTSLSRGAVLASGSLGLLCSVKVDK